MKAILTFLSALAICVGVNAQNIQYQTFSTPEVASMAAEVKTPVSLSSGAMNVEIPLYTLREGDIELPISLTYDATGVRVGTVPGVVGQNWTLKTGGLVTRVVKGAPDEALSTGNLYLTQYGYAQLMNPYYIGYTWNAELLNSSSWNTTTMVRDVASLVNGIDLEPDEFVFNFCGHSGSFYMDRSGQGVVIGQKGYKIEGAIMTDIPIYNAEEPIWEKENGRDIINDDAYTYCNFNENMFVQLRQARIIGIKITDPYGYEYYFGQYERYLSDDIDYLYDNFDGIEITSSFFGQIYDEIYNTWYLMKIVSPTKREMTFTYENGYSTASFNTSFTMSNMKVRDDGGHGWLDWFWRAGYMQVNRSEFSIDGSLIRPQVLKSIQTDNYKIDFTTTASSALDYDYAGQIQSYLDYIAMNHYSPDILSMFWYGIWPVADPKVVYSIALGNTSNPNRLPVFGRQLYPGALKREKLSEMTIQWKHSGSTPIKYAFSYRENPTERLQLTSIQKRAGTQTLPPYVFTYNNSKRLPAYLDPRTDHWGYYNANSNLSSYYVSNYTGYLAYKNANASYIDSEVLLKIEYPTGGTKEFVYEPNKYSRVVRRDTSTGALSIASVSETVGGGLRIKEIVEKPDANSESEHRIYTYSDGILNGEHQYYWPNYSGRLLNNNTYTSTRFFSHSILPVSSNPAGGVVSYSKVTETIPGNGRIERTYTNHDTYLDENAVACIDPQKSPYSPLTGRAALRGNLLKEEVFKENSTVPVSRTTNTYTPLNTANYIRSMHTRGYTLFDGQSTNAIEGSSYKIYTDPVQLAGSTEEIYPDNSTTPLQTVTNYTYNNYFDIDTEEIIGSNEGSATIYKTTYSYVHNTPDADMDVIPAYMREIRRSTLMNRNMVKLPVYIYKFKDNVADHKFKYQYAYSQFDSGRVFERYIGKSYGTVYSIYESVFDLDKRGNPMSLNYNNISVTYIWGYNYQFIVAAIKNEAWGNVNNALIELGADIHSVAAATVPDMTLINSLRTKLKGAEITTYTYDPLVGVKTVTDPNGFVSYYNYDALGRLTEIRDQNNKLLESYEYHYNQ